jgi:hypothetical protein
MFEISLKTKLSRSHLAYWFGQLRRRGVVLPPITPSCGVSSELTAKIVDLRIMKKTYDEIGLILGIPPARVKIIARKAGCHVNFSNNASQ